MVRLHVGIVHSKELSYWKVRFSHRQPERKAIYGAIRERQPEQAHALGARFFAAMQEGFERDPVFGKIRLTDQTLVESINDAVREFRTSDERRRAK
jgi:hypothetical protein